MTTIAIGTEKGAYLLDLAGDVVDGPMFPGWKVTAFGRTAGGSHLAGVGSNWFGAAIHRSSDLSTWSQVEPGPAYDADRPLSEFWTFHTTGGVTYAGVAEAGLFRSDDDGATWSPVDSLNEHPTRADWAPGGGGLCAHSFLCSGERQWVGISAVGVLRSDDGGTSWTPKNDGVPSPFADADAPRPAVGYCVHSLAQDAASPDRMWRQDHAGVFRTGDGADTWERIESGLPAAFGFVMHRDDSSGRLFTVPLHSDGNRVPVDGAFRAYVSVDDGDTWQVSGRGWSETPDYTTVLRGAATGDNDGVVVLGTTGGSVWVTEDAGDHWRSPEPRFPRINTVALV